MNLRPLVGFWWKHGQQLEAMLSGPSTPAATAMLLEDVAAVASIVKRRFPALASNGLVDDAVSTLREMLAAPGAPRQPSQGAGNQS